MISLGVWMLTSTGFLGILKSEYGPFGVEDFGGVFERLAAEGFADVVPASDCEERLAQLCSLL
eukprot:3612326-Pleurochrysis_carterae.AAC.1